MVWQTNHLLLNDYSNNYFLFFVFFSTITSYSFHWYLTTESAIPSPRIEWGERNKTLHLVLFIIGIIGTGIFFLYTAPKIPHPLFRSLRKIAVGKTLFLAMVWMFVTTILPIEIAEQPWKTEFS